MNESTASLGLAQPRSNRLFRYALPAALLVALVAGFFGYRAWTARPPASTPAASQVISAVELEERYGLRVNLVAVTAAGGLVDVRLKIVDGGKAKALLQDPNNFPALWVPDMDITLELSDEARSQEINFEDNGNIFLMFPNTRNAVKPGTPLTVMFGDLRLEPIIAK
jgi:hypothetical protein